MQPFVFRTARRPPNPDEIAGLVMWLDPDQISGVNQGEDVTTFPDRSGNSLDAVQNTTAQKPHYDDGSTFIHGKPGVRFDASADERMLVAANALLDNGQFTYFVGVFLTELPTSSRFLINKTATNANTVGIRQITAIWQASIRLASDPSTTLPSDTRGYFCQGFNILALSCDGTTKRLYINGQLAIEEAIGGDVDTTAGGNLSIGAHPTTSNTTLGAIHYDHLYYDQALSEADIFRLFDWYYSQYPKIYDYVDVNPVLDVYHDNFRESSAAFSLDGSTAYMSYINNAGTGVRYATAPLSDPWNFTDQGDIFVDGAISVRGNCLKRYSGNWYLFYDRRDLGQIELRQATTIGGLAGAAVQVVLTGTTGDESFVRYPWVLTPDETHDGQWHMLYDGRLLNPTAGFGSVYHATSTDGIAWVRDTANNPVIPRTGDSTWEASDIGSPCAIYTGGQYLVTYFGFDEAFSTYAGSHQPHQIGVATSPDLSTITRDSNNPVIVFRHNVTDDEGGVSDVSPRFYLPGDGNLYLNINQAFRIQPNNKRNRSVYYRRLS